jgi:site-specific recombinase XerD
MIHLDEAHRNFLNHLETKNRSDATILAYGKDIEQLVNHLKGLGHTHVHHVKKDHLEDFMQKLTSEGYTSKSVSRKTNSTKTFFRFLQINELITDDPAYLLAHPNYTVKPPRILSKTEYRALRDATKHEPRMYAIVELLLQTGIRIGELASIQMDDVSFSEGNLQGEVKVRNAKGHISRTVPLNKSSELALKKYLEIRPKSVEKTLFITKNGKPLLVRNIRTSIDKYFKTAGIKDAKVNDLRHTFVAHHLESGASILLISKIAGHKRISTTEKYLEHIQSQGKSADSKARLEEL